MHSGSRVEIGKDCIQMGMLEGVRGKGEENMKAD